MVTLDLIYKQLADEKQLGWQSAAVSALWKSRTRKFKVQSSGNRAEDSKKFTPEEGKYFKFYSDMLPQFAPPGLFEKNSHYRFIDIGAAPGGMSKYLIQNFDWKGYAFSLSPAESGLEMKYSNPSSLLFSMSNQTRENEWSRVLALCKKEGFENVHFVNTGVVVDFGQVDADGGGSAEMTCRAISSSISQMLIILKSLKNGGAAMWIHSLSHIDTFFFFMQHILACFESVRVLNTLSPARSPVYVIMSGYRKNSPAATTFEKVLLRNNGTVSVDTVRMWQVSDFKEVERTLVENPTLRADLQSIWNQKRQCLRETRLFAEKKFSDEDSKSHTAPPPQIDASEGICGVSLKESVKTQGSLLTIPKTFGPPPRKSKV